MTNSEVTEKQLNAHMRFLKLLPHGQDITLVILKGHLLIEEQVRQIINERVKYPDAVYDAKLDCHQAICLAEALCVEETAHYHEGVWRAVKKLNKIRNYLAHHAETPSLDDRLNDFVTSIHSSLIADTDDLQERFEIILWVLFEAVDSLVERPTATIYELKKNEEKT